MADDMETWIKTTAQRVVDGSRCLFEQDTYDELCELVRGALLSAVMRERESKWIEIDDAARDGQRYMLGWNDRTIQSWAAPGRYVWDKWLDDNARELAPPTHYQALVPPDHIGDANKMIPAPPRTAETPDA